MVMGGAALAAVLVAAIVILWERRDRLRRHVKEITGHRRAIASQLRERRATESSSESRYWEHLHSTTAPVLVTTPEGDIIAASMPLVEMLGYKSEEELKQVKATDLYADCRDRERVMGVLLKERGEIRNGQFRMKRHDNRAIHVLTSMRMICGSNGHTYYEGVLTDITELCEAADERQRLAAELHLARKLEVIGQLAAGIAHEINTPIQFIGDNTHYLKRAFDRLLALLDQYRFAAGSAALAKAEAAAGLPALLIDVTEAFEDNFEGIGRVSETVQAMKEFVHPGDAEKTATDLNQALQTTLIVARNEYRHLADVRTEFGEIPSVDCRRGEINKVFLNLIVNAAQAIEAAAADGRPGRGTITVRTLSDAMHVHIVITDTGCGISPSVMTRIFDPFFTTQPVGKGTGQGLAIARTIIHNHGGQLDVASTVGRGSSFTIRLPLAAPTGLVAPDAGTSNAAFAAPID
jgi:PAS domain S-box-containing protein